MKIVFTIMFVSFMLPNMYARQKYIEMKQMLLVSENDGKNIISSSSDLISTTSENSKIDIFEISPDKQLDKDKQIINYIQLICKPKSVAIPYTKKYVISILKYKGYDKDSIDRILLDLNIDWKKNALIIAKYYCSLNKDNSFIKKILDNKGFRNDEINYALININSIVDEKYLDIKEFDSLSVENIIKKMNTELEIPTEQIAQIIIFFIAEFKNDFSRDFIIKRSTFLAEPLKKVGDEMDVSDKEVYTYINDYLAWLKEN